MSKKQNPFQSFIVKATSKAEVPPITPPKHSSPVPSSKGNQNTEALGEDANWVHYIDDESGFPYVYNTLTGEARWLTETEYQDYDQQAVVVVESPWETMYDNDGNMYYYNKESGVSAWEIPAEDLVKYGLETLQNQNADYYQEIGLDPTLGNQLSSKLSSMNLLEEALGESFGEGETYEVNDSYKQMTRNNSMKSVRSARSFGLKTPNKSMEELANQIETQLGSGGQSLKSAMSSSTKKKGGKTQLSFVLGTNKSFKVDDSLKPTTPSNKKSKSGFEILKISSKVLRAGQDETGDVWLEYQSAEDGPLFYAKKGLEGGQWRIPTTFNVIELDESQDLDVAPPYNSKKDDVTITPSETSLEVVDFFSLDKDEVLKIQSPSLMKQDPNAIGSLKYDSKREVPSKSSFEASTPNEIASSLKLPDIPQDTPTSSAIAASTSASEKVSTPLIGLPVQSIAQLPQSNMELKLQSMKAEAALELEKLRMRLETVKQDAIAPSPKSLELRNSISLSTPYPFTFASIKPPSPQSVSAFSKPADIVPKKNDSISDNQLTEVRAQPTQKQQIEIITKPVADGSQNSSNKAINGEKYSPSHDSLKEKSRVFSFKFSENTNPSIASPNENNSDIKRENINDNESRHSLPTQSISLQQPITPSPTLSAISPISSVATPAVSSSVHSSPPKLLVSKPSSAIEPSKLEEILWDEIIPRAHLLRTTLRWECYFDAQTKLKFYKRRSDGFLQKDKPYDFDTFNLSSHSLLGIAKQESNGNTPSAPIVANPSQVTFTTDTEGNQTVSPKKSKKQKKQPENTSSSSFLTGVDIAQKESESSDDESPKIVSSVTATEEILKVIPTEVEEDVLEQMMRELAFVERYSSRAIRAIYQERQHLEQFDADKLTSRLEMLAEKRLKMEESKRMRTTERYVAGMDTDQVKRLQARSKQLLERCYEIQEFIEPSPVEHSMTEDQILRSAILQRECLSFPLDMKHDQPMYHLGPPELLFASSIETLPYWRKQAHHTDKMGWLKLRSGSPNLSDYVYYHTHSHIVQSSEPFDAYIRRDIKEMKKQNWGDYEVKVSINQSVLENSGIELWEDGKGGYLFHCPMRGSFSSNGRFDPITFHATTGRPNNFRRKAAVQEESWTNKLKPTIWKQLGLKKDTVSNQVRELFATANVSMDILREKHTEPISSSGIDHSNWTMATSDSSDNLQLASQASQEVASSMKSLKEKAQKKPSYFQDTLQALEKLQEASHTRKQDPIINKQKEKLQSTQTTSILEEAFSIAQQVYDPGSIMATNEDAWKFEAAQDDSGNMIGPNNDDDRNNNFNDSVPSSHSIESLKYESRFDEETMQKYQQLLIFAYQDPENPGHLFNLMEFLLQQGLNKAALATLQRAISVIQSYDSYKPGKYEQCLLQIMKSKLSIKCHNQFTGYQDILKLLNTFPDKPFVLTFVGTYFTRIHHYDWAQIHFIGALMQSPSYELALVKFAHLLFLQGDLKQASRYLQKTVLENENGLWGRRSKLEVAWLLEMLGADDEALVVGYKALIGVHARDSVQAKTLLALGNLYQRMRKFRLAFDFYQRAIQVDRDFGLSSILFATAQSVQYVQNQVIPSSIPFICAENGGGYDASADTKAVDDMMATKKTIGKSSVSNRPPSASATHRTTVGNNAANATPNKLTRPKSAGANNRSRSHGKTQTLLSTSLSAFPPVENTTINRGQATVSTGPVPSKSLVSQLPPSKRTSATIAAADQSSKPLVAHVQNIAWKQMADALYRRGLILIPDSSYHWISLLAYGDFVMAVMKDTKRALEYYEDAVKESFSTQIWPIVALGGALQYVTNDLTAAKRLYVRALRSRHPPTPTFMQPHAERQKNGDNDTNKQPDSRPSCPLSSFRGFLKKKLKGDQSVFGSHSRVSSTTSHAQHTGKHLYGSRHGYSQTNEDDDDDRDDENDTPFDAAKSPGMKSTQDSLSHAEQFRLQREEALSLLQSATLSKISEPAHDPTTVTSPGVQKDLPSANSNYQRRMQDTANLVLQEKECQVLYIAIAYLLWDMHDLHGAVRFALAALKVNPQYAPALRCMGFLLFYIHNDRRLSFRYFIAAADVSFSTVSTIAIGESNTNSSTSTSGSGYNSSSSIPLCHDLSALRTLAIIRAMRCQYDQAMAGMERILLQSTTCRFAHRSLAVWYYQVKQHPEKALQHLHSAWELSAFQDVEALRWKAQILMDAQAFKEARVCLLECLRLSPYDGLCYANVAMCIYFMCRENHPEPISQYEERRYASNRRRSEKQEKEAARKQYSVEELEAIAHSKDIFQLFEIAKVISAEHCIGSFAEYHRRHRQRRQRRQQQQQREGEPSPRVDTADAGDASQDKRKSFCHYLGGPTIHITGAVMDDDDGDNDRKENETSSDAEAYFIDPHADGKDTSSSLAYVHFLQGCLDFLVAPSLADFGIDEEDACEEARTSALAQAKTSFSTAALYAQGCDQTSHHWYPLSLFHLGQIAEEELDLITAERLYSEAVAVQNIHPIAFAQLQDCNAKLLKLHKDRLKELKRPYTKKGNIKKSRSGKQPLQESTFSDFQPDEKLLKPMKSTANGGGSKKKSSGGRKDEGLEWMLRQSAQGKGLLDASMAQFVKTSFDANADAKKDGLLQAENPEAMGDNNGNNGFGSNEGSDEEDEANENEDDDEKSEEDRGLLDDVPLAVQNRTMERCFKRVMMHTRVQEAILLRKYQLNKQLKDVKLTFPNLSTYALPTRQINRRHKTKRSASPVQLQMGVSMGALDMIKSFFYVDHDWLERCLYATAKCEDWATMLQCYYK